MPSPLSLSFGLRSASDVVGLDIQPGLIAAAQARANGALVAQRAVALQLPADTMREGDVVDPAALSDSLRKLFQGSRLGKRVRVGVANQRTVMRTLELPPVTDAKELAAAVRFQAEDQVPMPLANAVLDFQPLGVVETPAGPRQRVVLVAAQRDMIERLLAAVRGAGLTPVGVDMSAFALIRSLYRDDIDHGERVLYLNVDGLTNVAIAEGTVCRFTRVLGGGIEEMVAELAERRDIPHDQARELLADVDLAGPSTEVVEPPAPVAEVLEPVPANRDEASTAKADDAPTEALTQDEPASASQPTAASPPAADPQGPGAERASAAAAAAPKAQGAAREPGSTSERSAGEVALTVLENGVRAIAGEVRNSLDFHRSQEGGADVSRVVLSGRALELRGFAEALQASLGVDVRAETVGVANDAQLHGVSAHRLAVATGLATTEVRQ